MAHIGMVHTGMAYLVMAWVWQVDWDRIRFDYLNEWRPSLVVWADAWAGNGDHEGQIYP